MFERKRRWCVMAGAAIGLLLAGCVPDTVFRPTAGSCENASACQGESIEIHKASDPAGTEYLLGVVEFDDHGAELLTRQMDALMARLIAESRNQDLCLVVYVHGWKHNASPTDPDVQEFRLLLDQLTLTEAQHGRGVADKPRKVVGVYAGWRGQSFDGPDLVDDATFWMRKDAASRVAAGSIRGLLGRLRALRDMLDQTTVKGRRVTAESPIQSGETLRSTRLMTIGHSFGGLIVYTALAQYLIDRAAGAEVAAAMGNTTDADKRIAAYGDLVVIVNPAVEATSFEPIRRLMQNRPRNGYARDQKPAFVEVTSSADDATGIAFPLARSLNTAFEDFTSSEQRREATSAIGHYQPFWTHDLTTLRPDTREQVAPSNLPGPQSGGDAAALVRAECRAYSDFENHWRQDGYLRPGWVRTYSAGAVLTQRGDGPFDPNDPYWVVRADASLIPSHSDITRPVFVDFVRQLYDDLLLGSGPCVTAP